MSLQMSTNGLHGAKVMPDFFLQPALLLSFEFVVQPLRLKAHLH